MSTQFQASILRDTAFVVSAKQCSFAGSKLYGVDLSKALVADCDFRKARFSAKEPVKLGDTTGSNFLQAICDTSNSTSAETRTIRSVTARGENLPMVYHRTQANTNTTFFPCQGGRTTPLLTDGCVISTGTISDNKGMPCEAAVPLLLWLIPTVAVTVVIIIIAAALYGLHKHVQTKRAAESASGDIEEAALGASSSINDGDNESAPLLPQGENESRGFCCP